MYNADMQIQHHQARSIWNQSQAGGHYLATQADDPFAEVPACLAREEDGDAPL
jgi:hypothetical protein